MDRVGAAAAAGFSGCEILFPGGADPANLRDALERQAMPMVLINTPSYADTGLPDAPAANPTRRPEFREQFEATLSIARQLKPQRIHVMSGTGFGPASRACLIENLKWAAERAPDQPMTLEPINTHDLPGYFLSDFGLALEILDEVGNPHLGLQFDTYHAARISGDPWAIWREVAEHVTHIQVGRFPDRGEPIGGAFDHSEFFDHLDHHGYDGWVSGEYRPVGKTVEGLSWIKKPY